MAWLYFCVIPLACSMYQLGMSTPWIIDTIDPSTLFPMQPYAVMLIICFFLDFLSSVVFCFPSPLLNKQAKNFIFSASEAGSSSIGLEGR